MALFFFFIMCLSPLLLQLYFLHFFSFALCFFRSFIFLTLQKRAHARLKQNKVNIFSTKIIQTFQIVYSSIYENIMDNTEISWVITEIFSCSLYEKVFRYSYSISILEILVIRNRFISTLSYIIL